MNRREEDIKIDPKWIGYKDNELNWLDDKFITDGNNIYLEYRFKNCFWYSAGHMFARAREGDSVSRPGKNSLVRETDVGAQLQSR